MDQALKLLEDLRADPERAYSCYRKIAHLDFTPEQREKANYELGIICYYLGKMKEGHDALNDNILSWPYLAAGRKEGGELAWQSLSNLYWYLKPIPVLKWTSISIQGPPGYNCLNPSIIPWKGGYLANVRQANYTVIEGDYHSNSPDGIIRNVNYLCYYTEELQLTSVRPLPTIPIDYPVNAYGLEDIRLYYDRGEVIFTCNSRNNHPHVIPRVSFGRITSFEPPQIEVTHQPSPDRSNKCEKNWLFIRKDTYLYDPFSIMRKGRIVKTAPRVADLRCSAGPIRYRQGLLFLTHQVIFRGNERAYLHRFCHWSKASYLISDPFIFHHRGLEYAIGLTWHKGNLLLGLGLRDREAWWAEIERGVVDSLLDEGKCIPL